MYRLLAFAGLRGAAALASFSLTFIVAKAFESDISAAVFYFMSLMLSISAIGRLGGDVQLVRQVSNLISKGQQEAARRVLPSALGFSALLSLAIVLLLWAVGARLQIASADVNYTLLAAGVVITGWLYAATELLKAFLRRNVSIVLQGVIPPMLVIIMLWLLVPKFEPATLIVVSYGVAASLAIFAALYVARGVLSPNASTTKPYVRGSLSYAPKAVIAYVYPQLPVLYAGTWLHADDVDAINVIIKMAMLVGLPIVAINAYYAPVIARAYASREWSNLSILLANMQKVSSACGVALAIALLFDTNFLFSYFAIDLNYTLAFAVVIAGQIVNAVTGPSSIVGAMVGMDSVLNATSLLMAGVFVVMCYLLWGVTGGVLFSYAFAMAVENIVVFFLVSKGVSAWRACREN